MLCICIGLALAFEFVNGFHDTANAVATVIYTRSLRPWTAVILSGICNFLGVFIGGIAVALSIINLLPVELLVADGTGAGLAMLLALLLAAITWNLGTWWFGIPSSSSHALVGGLVGATLLAAGSGYVKWGFADILHGKIDGVAKILIGLVISPLIGFGVGFLLQKF